MNYRARPLVQTIIMETQWQCTYSNYSLLRKILEISYDICKLFEKFAYNWIDFAAIVRRKEAIQLYSNTYLWIRSNM